MLAQQLRRRIELKLPVLTAVNSGIGAGEKPGKVHSQFRLPGVFGGGYLNDSLGVHAW